MSNPTIEAAWNEYAERSGLTIEGVACSPAKAQSAYFAFEAGWNRRAKPEGLSIALREVTDKLSATAAENLSLGMENRQLREQLQARAQPEGEAPQAVAEVIEECVPGTGIMARAVNFIGSAARPGDKLYQHPPAATLSPLCGAQHAESGKEAAGVVLPYGDALDIIAARAAREVGGIFTDAIPIKSLVVYAGAVARLALAAQSQGARCTTCDGTGMVHRADGEYMGECTCEAAQQAAAPGARIEELESALEVAMNRETVLEDRIHELEHMLDGSLINEGTSAPGTPEAPVDKTMPGWERGIATVTLNGHQLREALGFINPDGAGDPDQLDDELTFGVVQHKDDDGNAATGLCCWNGDTHGVLPLDSEPRATQLDGGQEGSE